MPDLSSTVSRLFFPDDGKKLGLFAYVVLVLVCLACFLPGLASLPPTDRDESLFAQASKQMVETDNYVDIRVQDEPRYKKPIGIYWLQSASVKLFSPDKHDAIWAYRLPSLLGAIIAVLMTAALGATLFSPATGFWGAVMLAGCPLLNVEARLATTDAALLGAIMAALYALAKAYATAKIHQPPRVLSKWGLPLVFWTAFAVAVLIKGPIILLPVLGVLLWIQITEKDLSWLKSLRPFVGFLYALLLIAPWFVAIALQSHGAFFQQSAGNDMLAKIWEGQNRGIIPPGAHLVALPLLFFPTSLLIVFALPDIWKNRRDLAVKFCLGWMIPMWLIFEMSLTKLFHYVLPAYPAIALLTAHFVLAGCPSVTTVVRRIPITLLVGFWLFLGGTIALLTPALATKINGAFALPQALAGMALFVLMGIALVVFIKRRKATIAVLTLASFIFLSVTVAITVPGLQHVWMSRDILALSAKAAISDEPLAGVPPCETRTLVSAGYHEPSLVFLGGTDTIKAKDGIEAAKALKKNACRIAVVRDRHREEFLDVFSKDKWRAPHELGTLSGVNLGKGTPLSLSLFVLRPAAP